MREDVAWFACYFYHLFYQSTRKEETKDANVVAIIYWFFIHSFYCYVLWEGGGCECVGLGREGRGRGATDKQ